MVFLRHVLRTEGFPLVFGDITDKGSAVSERKAQPLDYTVLPEINVKPRTTYSARIRNPNKDMKSGSPEKKNG